jgi:hypothetical protein
MGCGGEPLGKPAARRAETRLSVAFEFSWSGESVSELDAPRLACSFFPYSRSSHGDGVLASQRPTQPATISAPMESAMCLLNDCRKEMYADIAAHNKGCTLVAQLEEQLIHLTDSWSLAWLCDSSNPSPVRTHGFSGLVLCASFCAALATV